MTWVGVDVCRGRPLLYDYIDVIDLPLIQCIYKDSQLFSANSLSHMSRLVGKPTICIGGNKDADQLRGNREADLVTAKLISAFVFATRIVQFLFYLNPKFQASSSFLCLYRSVCVGPVRKPHCWFSHEAAHIAYHQQRLKQ